MPPSHHSSSSHRSHSSHSHHSSSHSHSSSRSYHSSSSHSSSFRSSSSPLIVTPNYRSRSNQPTGYSGVSPRVYRCKSHDYVHYKQPWKDEKTGIEYKAGYYDEEGNFYQDVVFSKQGEILDTATVNVLCDFCRMEDSRRWADREKPCTHCGGTVTLVSQVDDLVDDTRSLDDLARDSYMANEKQWNKQFYLFTLILIFLSPCILGVFAFVGELFNLIIGHVITENYEIVEYNYGQEYNIPNLGLNLYLKEDEDGYVIVEETDYASNYRDGGYKRLLFDSDGNYYEKETDMYIYLNEDIDPPQFQYWLEGLSSQYGDYGWMEYDAIEQCWYIEVSDGNWEPLSDELYNEFADRLWHIDYTFELKE